MRRILVLLVSVNVICSLSGAALEWDQYLGNPGKTGYNDYDGPDIPKILWEVELSSLPGHPFISGGRVVVECGGRAVLIDLLTGALLSNAVADVESLTGAYPAGNIILGTTGGGFLYRINPDTGNAAFDVKIPDRFFCWVHCHPIIFPDRVIFPSTPVVCLSRIDYSTLWDLESSLGQLYPEDGEVYMIAASSERLHTVMWGAEENLWTVDSRTGEFLWAKKTFKTSMIATEGSVLYAAGENLHALDGETGELLWTFEFDSDYVSSNIMVGPHAVYVTDKEKLYSVDKFTGTLNWEVQWEENPFWMTYIVGTGNTVICSDVRDLTSFSAVDGTLLWNVHFRDYIDHDPKKSCPAVARGILVVSGEEGSNKLMALASDPDLFVMRGDALLSQDLMDSAIDAYKKAAELYEKRGDLSRSQEMQEQIQELETQPESLPSLTPSEPHTQIPAIAVVSIVVLIGILIIYYLAKRSSIINIED